MKTLVVPFYDLKREYRDLKKDIGRVIQTVLSKQMFVLGDELSQFEEEFASYLGMRYCVGVGSGTDGLILALLALGVKKGDEVITQANTFIATAYAIEIVGATPVLVDVDPLTHQIDTKKLEESITNKTKALIPVHLFGSPAPMAEIIQIATQHKLKVVEDACQAHGGEYDGKKLGNFGDVSVFSFYPSKNLGAYGDGGAICTSNNNIYKQLLLLRNYGERVKYKSVTFGTNTRLDELQAAVLRVKLRHLDESVKKRNALALAYNANLKSVAHPLVDRRGRSAYHLYVITSPRRNALMKHLENKGVQTHIHYPIPIHLQPALSGLGYKKGSFPVAESLALSSLSLPFFPGLRKKEVDYVCQVINGYSH